MNKNHHPNQTLLQFVIRAQQLARQDAQSDRGYAMLVTSMISIAMLSLLAAYVTMANMGKASTNAYVDGTNTFYAAESGLNRRAQQVRDKFIGYAAPTGTAPGSTAASISNCFQIGRDLTETPNDFECRNYGFTYNNNAAASRDSSGNTVINEQNDNSSGVNYIAYTYVADKTQYAAGSAIPRQPTIRTIPSGEPYAGLNAQEYKYSIYATANANQNVASGITPAEIEAKSKKQIYDAAVAAAPAIAPTALSAADAALAASYDSKRSTADTANAGRATRNNRTDTVLQMDFKSRVVPLFQFAAFYEGDLEINSSSNMTLGGRVHTNANLYAQPNTANAAISIDFLAQVTAVGSIYNQVDASGANGARGSVRALMTGTSCLNVTNCLAFPAYASTGSAADPALTALQLATFGGRIIDGAAGTKRLNVPQPGFLRKRNYYGSWTGNAATTTNNSGDYYSKADMRLEMLPDRDVKDFTTAPWTRDKAIIPFNFTAINSVATDTCTTTLPAKDASTTGVPTLASDPAEDYISPDRNNASTLKCHKFTKGQLQSLRQPVLVLTDLNQPNATVRTATGDTPAAGSEALILGRPDLSAVTPPVLSVAADTPANKAVKQAILRALQVAIVSTPTPVLFDELRQPVSASTNLNNTFTRLTNATNIPTLTDADRTALLAATPKEIAALLNAWFLPAPIQRIENSQPLVQIAENSRNSGFYNGQERRWVTMLQTNIASLSVWNRDGIYVEATNNDRKEVYATTDPLIDTAFSSGTGTSPTATNNLAFNRAVTIPAIPKGLQTLGLGSIDNTEGGLVFHATVSDDLNGDDLMSAASDVSLDFANPILKVNAVGTPVGVDNLPLPAGGTPIILDYPRKYRNGTSYQSPFGFAFNGGDYLPGPMTLVTDQAVYIQGDFNNQAQVQPTTPATLTNLPSANRLPASVVGDTITILSNQCINANPTSAISDSDVDFNDLGVPVGQLKCGLPRNATGSAVDFGTLYYNVTRPTAVNAAFLSYTRRSVGNLGAGRGFLRTGGLGQFSGALNNYIRMLEGWGQTQFFNYTGSMVSLGTPLEYSGQYFGGGTYYMIPVRNFNFDNNFNTFTSLPPLPPQAIYLQQDVFKRNYN